MISRTGMYSPNFNKMQSTKNNVVINNFGSQQKNESIFAKYDTNGDGILSETEKLNLMNDLGLDPNAKTEDGKTNVWDALGGLFNGIGSALPLGLTALFNKGGGEAGE